jgi:hypothetical protein
MVANGGCAIVVCEIQASADTALQVVSIEGSDEASLSTAMQEIKVSLPPLLHSPIINTPLRHRACSRTSLMALCKNRSTLRCPAAADGKGKFCCAGRAAGASMPMTAAAAAALIPCFNISTLLCRTSLNALTAFGAVANREWA